MVVKKIKTIFSNQRYYQEKVSLRVLLSAILISFVIAVVAYFIAGFKIIYNPEIAFHLAQVPSIVYICALTFLAMTVTIAQYTTNVFTLFKQEKERKHEIDHI